MIYFQRVFSALLLLSSAPWSASAHRPATTSPSCDEDYGSSTTAMPLADPSISWSFKHYLDCTNRAVWVQVTNEEPSQRFYVGVGVPTLDRFADLRANALIIGPGLPQLTADEWEQVPEEIRNDPVWNNENVGAYFHVSPQDQSTCDHLGTVMQGESSVVDGRCDFFEPFGQTHSWRVLDADNNMLVEGDGAAYYVAVYLQDDTSGKIGIALGTWVEDFITQYDTDTPTCTRNLQDFSEKQGTQEECFPVVSCPTAERPIGCEEEEAEEEQVCPLGEVCDEDTLEGECVTAGISYSPPSMGFCGGELCPAAVQTWDDVNMKMHHGMMNIEYTGNPDIDFVRGMIPHHIGAVDMCEVLISNLTCTTVESIDNLEGLVHFCNHVQLEQEIEVGGMRRWLEQNNFDELAPCSSGDDMMIMGGDMINGSSMAMTRQQNMDNDENGMMMMDMMESCGNLTTPSSEKFLQVNEKMHDLMAVSYSCDHSVDFVRMMMPHHAGAVVMCDILMETTQDEYLIELCDNVTLTQRAEIDWMSDWLAARDIAPAAPCELNCAGDTAVEIERDGHDSMGTGFNPCEDTLSTSSFCHGIAGTTQDGYCRCDEETFASNGYSCDEQTWVDGFGLFVPSVFCKRSCGFCPSGERPLWVEPCEDLVGGMNKSMEEESEEKMTSSQATSIMPTLVVVFASLIVAVTCAL